MSSNNPKQSDDSAERKFIDKEIDKENIKNKPNQ